MTEIGRFDSDMQMFVEEPRDPSLRHLLFEKHLISKGIRKEMDYLSNERVVFDSKLRQHMAGSGDY